MASRHFNDATDIPTQIGPAGIRYDFNSGPRVHLPNIPAGEDPWQIIYTNGETDSILYNGISHGGLVTIEKKFAIPVRIIVRRLGREFFRHDFNAHGKIVIARMPDGTIGDTIAWFPYAIRYAEKHGCHMHCVMSDKLSALFKDAYPHVRFMNEDTMLDEVVQERAYATYKLFLFIDDNERNNQPTDFQFSGLHKNAGYIMGVPPVEEKPTIALPWGERPVPEKYVCVAVQASSQCKYWNNPNGWQEVVRHLKGLGYRIIAIDRNSTWGSDGKWNRIPEGIEDQTGERPLQERVNWLRHAEFFIGVSSGLSWLAWVVGIPVVMISGFTHPTNEFETPYRIINWESCNSCWNDRRIKWASDDFWWCPSHKGTAREYECSKTITGKQVINAIERLRRDHALEAPTPAMVAETVMEIPPPKTPAIRPKVRRLPPAWSEDRKAQWHAENPDTN